jgi:hypothetical protein
VETNRYAHEDYYLPLIFFFFHNLTRSLLPTVSQRQNNTVPSHPLSTYTGKFNNQLWGTMTIAAGANGLQLQFATTWSDIALEHWQYDTWAIAADEAFFEFVIDDISGSISAFTLMMIGESQTMLFTRIQ